MESIAILVFFDTFDRARRDNFSTESEKDALKILPQVGSYWSAAHGDR